MIQIPKNAWKISFPQLALNPVNFVFSCTLPIGLVGFKFMWFLGVWNIWMTLPTGEIRQLGGYPNAVDWTGFSDYYAQLITSLDTIGQNDLSNVTMVVYQL